MQPAGSRILRILKKGINRDYRDVDILHPWGSATIRLCVVDLKTANYREKIATLLHEIESDDIVIKQVYPTN